MSKIKKFVIIPLVTILVILAVTVLILSLVRVNPLTSNFEWFDRVALLRTSDGNEFNDVIVESGANVTENTLANGIKSSDFSIIQAILEGKFSYKLKLKQDEDNNDMTVSAASIKSYGALEGEYVLKFYYNQPEVLEFEGKKIFYDRMLVRLYDTNGEIKDIDCIPYLDYNIDNESMESEYDENGRIGSLYYNTNVFTVKLNTSRLMRDIKEMLEQYQ